MFDGNLLNFFWSMMIIFFWVTAFIIWFQCFFDMFRRDDLSGVMKAVWVVVLIILPWIGALVYLITRPKVTASDIQGLVRAEAAAKAAGGVSTADELQKLASLKEAGVINDKQYEDLKAKLVS
jgi:hypothetical protein